jgi:replicative DNA helicase
MADFQVPKNIPAEEKAIAACLSHNERARSIVLSMLTAKDFYSEVYRLIFAAIEKAELNREEYEKVNDSNVSRYLDRDALKDIVKQIYESFPTGSNAHLYARDVLAASKARRAMDISDRLKASLGSGISEEYPQSVHAAYSDLGELISNDPHSRRAIPVSGDLEDMAQWLHRCRTNEGVTGIRTGLAHIDNALKGLQPGRLYVLAGRPGSGKSLLVGQIGLEAARQGNRVLLCSPEMDRFEYLRRLACAAAGVSAEDVEDGKFSAEDQARILEEADKMSGLDFLVYDHGSQTVQDIRAQIMRHQPDLLIVDYLQRLMPEDRRVGRYEQVSQISFDLDRIKKDFHIPVVAAAQLNRSVDSRNDKRPVMSDLRDSGTIEQDADAIGMLYRPGHYDSDEDPNVIKFGLEKNRHGSLWHDNLYTDEALWIRDNRKPLSL